MGATFSRLKNWGAEILTNADLNAEIDNILNNLGTSGVDDYSTNSAQMRLQTDPGTVGSESLATSLSGEIERLRFVIKRIIGSSATYWYEAPSASLTDLVAVLGTGLPTDRIVSGNTSTRSAQLKVLIPNGAANSVLLDATPSPFIYYVNGVQYTISADVTLTGLGLAPAANNTCVMNNSDSSAQQWTKFLGQYGTEITVTSMGSSISALIGTIAAFKVGATEYFIAYVKSSTKLAVAFRGSFYDSTGTAKPAVPLTLATSTFTLMRLAWIFATTAGTMTVCYNNPVVSFDQPSTPATGDYWFDLNTNTWKTYNATSYVTANATLIGMTMCDTANCVAARTFDTFKAVDNLNTMQLALDSVTQVSARDMYSEVSVFGTTKRYGSSRPAWNIATDLDTGITEAASTYYYLYIKETGDTVISDIAPMWRRDLLGMYHPSETWRCVGFVFNDASSNLITPVRSLVGGASDTLLMGESVGYMPSSGISNQPWSLYPDKYLNTMSNPGNQVFVGSSGQWGDLGSLILPIGTWALTATYVVKCNGAVTATRLGISLGTVAGNTGGGIEGYNEAYEWVDATSGQNRTLVIPEMLIVNSSAATTYYLKQKADTTHANLQTVGWRFTARRIDSVNGTPL